MCFEMDRETIKIANKFASKIRKAYKPREIILFGSRARGDNFRSSDFEFIIVSKKFFGTPFVLRPAEIYDYWNEKVDIEPLCYTPEEFERKRKIWSIVKRAVKEGI